MRLGKYLHVSDPIRIEVNYDLSQEEAVKRPDFTRVDDHVFDVTFRNGLHGIHEHYVREIGVLRDDVPLKYVLDTFDELDVEHSRPQQLLEHARRHPHKQRKYIIYSQWQMWREIATKKVICLCLQGVGHVRRLGLEPIPIQSIGRRMKLLVVCRKPVAT